MFIPFEEEMKDTLSPERATKYKEWIRQSLKARETGDLGHVANQIDKAEEIMTWVTFAPLLRMSPESRTEAVSIIIGTTLIQADETRFEALLRPPKSYLEGLKRQVEKHPVRYIREQAKDRISRGKPLEGPTHIDCLIMAKEDDVRDVVIGIEAKMMSDISTSTKFDARRNQLARIIDVLLEREEQNIYVLLVAPSFILSQSEARLYTYKIKEYNMGKRWMDLPHRGQELLRVREIASKSWSMVAGTIWERAEDDGVVSQEEVGWAREFYEERGGVI